MSDAGAQRWDDHLASNGSHPLCRDFPFPCQCGIQHRDVAEWAAEQAAA